MLSATRLIQRFESFSRAFTRLDELVDAMTNSSDWRLFNAQETGLTQDIAREALIKRFEFTQELSWNLLRDYLLYQGETDIAASRDTYRRSLKLGLINDRQWMDMINDRNLSAHDYDGSKTEEINARIISVYHSLLRQLLNDIRIKIQDITENGDQ